MNINGDVDGSISEPSHGAGVPSGVIGVDIGDVELTQFREPGFLLHPAFYTETQNSVR